MPPSLRATLTLQASQLLVVGAAFFVSLAAARGLSPAGRGDLALWLQIAYLLATVAILGLERPFSSRGPQPWSAAVVDMSRLTAPGLAILTIPAAGAAIFLAAGRGDLATACAIGVPLVLGTVFSRVCRTAFIVTEARRRLMILTSASTITLGLVAVVLLAAGVSSPAWWLAGYALSSMPFLVAVARACATARRSSAMSRAEAMSKADASGLRRSGLTLVPASIANTAMLRSDRFLLPALASSTELGLYATVATIIEMTAWPVTNWADTRLRAWRAEIAVRGSVSPRPILAATAVTLALAAMCSGIAVLAVHLVLPPTYRPALSLIPVLAVANVVFAVGRIQQGVLIAHGRAARASASTVAGMVAALGLYVLLIPTSGSMGAAVGSLCSYVIAVAAGAVPWPGSHRPRAAEREVRATS